MDRDAELEKFLTSEETAAEIATVRSFLLSQGSSIKATMRETIRIHKLKELDLGVNPVLDTVFFEDITLGEQYIKQKDTLILKQEELRKQEELDKLTQHNTENYDDFLTKVSKGK